MADYIQAEKARLFSEFLVSDEFGPKYSDKIKKCFDDKKYRVIVNINDLRVFNRDATRLIMKRPREYMVLLQAAVTETAKDLDPSFGKVLKTRELQVGFEGSFGANSVNPRGLLSSLLNNLVEVEGIVTRCSLVRPKILKSVQYCPATKAYSTREFRDNTCIDIGIEVGGTQRLPTGSALPTKDENNNPLELEYGLCQYKDFQTVTLQEMPERAKVGQLPRSVELILEYDLVDRVKPGDRIQCVGVYRPLPVTVNGVSSSNFKSAFICNNVSVLGKEVGAVQLTGPDVGHIRALANQPKVLDILSRSICPSIFGHDFIKKALILQLLGGCERNLENGTHLRGDINVMMVGDPSTAKSQLLRTVMDIAPLAISTTGRGSSGVGLTAAVTMDADSRERRLEAGAMVLADRGIVCIDEFDKMSENDRVAIHEVMEQQTVTIAKAGIHASLNARCSVLAAANPVYGQYDRSRRPQENIGLPDSLLSRFDLLFIVLDQLDPTVDKRIAEHVVRSHQYRRPGTVMEPEALNQNLKLNLDDDAEMIVDTPVWQHGGKKLINEILDGSGDVLTKEFLRKYIHFAKNRIQPALSETAMEEISNAYAQMRAKQTMKNLPITARSLETLIRLSSASAKARLSSTVEEEDVRIAVDLVNFVYFHEIGASLEDSPTEMTQVKVVSPEHNMKGIGAKRRVPEKGSKKLSTDVTPENDEDEEDFPTAFFGGEDDDEEFSGIGGQAVDVAGIASRLKKRKVDDSQFSSSSNVVDVDDDLDMPIDRHGDRFSKCLEIIRIMFEEAGSSHTDVEVKFEDYFKRLLAATTSPTSLARPYSEKEVRAILSVLEEENKVMFFDDVIYKI